MTYNLPLFAIPPAGTRLRLPQMATLASPARGQPNVLGARLAHQQGQGVAVYA
ncbi:hypothetical protein [Corynebacterium sp. HMSC28B08]|uniref:hypothetical protein n=1 Tax=Corynebacterium sp. HMSC28B08 TaxID=1581066 RepID=UPI0014397EEC|nr:hypothetical protein [Corynebacterium sp. HMSC28B08]